MEVLNIFKISIFGKCPNPFVFFAKTKHFFEAATDAIQENETQKGEFYVAPLYNRLIKKGLKFKLDICNECDQFLIKGEPAINRIEYIMVGVANETGQEILGQVYLDELRFTNVKREKGNAYRLTL